MQHIEKSGFRRGEYVGYSAGRVFRITRVECGAKTVGWRACAAVGSHREDRVNFMLATTLRELDAKLADA